MSSVARIEAGAEAAGAEARSTREWVFEAVREGYLLHYREPRAFGEIDDDLRLLGGDTLYAMGLARLADEGDLEAVTVLSDLISDCARAESEGRPTEDLWNRASVALGVEYQAE